jgi:hypothetical protein
MQIEVGMDTVEINGQTVTRPKSISRSEWLDFWEKVQRDNGLAGLPKRQRG